jgi:cullin 3
MDQATATKSFATIDKAIDEIYKANASQLSFEELYRNAYHLCVHKHGDILYEGVKNSLSKHLQKSLHAILDAPNDELLNVVVKEWSLHHVSFNRLKDILLYMDRSYCIQKKKLSVYYYALQLFREEILVDAVKERLRATLLEQILIERRGLVIDRNTMKNVISMLITLGSDNISVEANHDNFNNNPQANHSNLNSSNLIYKNPYEDEFECFYLIETEQYYKMESLEYLTMNSCQDYMNKVEGRLQEEFSRTTHILSSSTEPKLKAILDDELISTHAKTLIEMETTGLEYMLNNHKLEDIAKMFNLFGRVPTCMDLLRDYVGRYIERKGGEILHGQETTKDPLLFVKEILALKEKFDEIISKSMKDEKKMLKKLKESFETFINKDNRTASHLASYIDELFKNDTLLQMSNEDEIENKLEKVMVIFKYISDKDIFENFYKTLLSRRLLSGRIISDEIERTMIAKLKAECGYQFTSKLEGMFMDMNISKTVMDDFKRSPHSQPNSSIGNAVECEIQLLTTGYWPLQVPQSNLELPFPFSDCCRRFTQFYTERNSGRKLTWMTNMGQCDIKVFQIALSLEKISDFLSF